MSVQEAHVGNHYMTQRRRNIYIVGEHWDFEWDEADIPTIVCMWSEGLSIVDMARSYGRSPWEMCMLLNQLIEDDKIVERHGGMFGNRRR